jgi:uncharacterized membrane protein
LGSNAGSWPSNVAAIFVMASVTYFTRIGGYVFLRNRSLGRRAKVVMDAAPGCVLLTVIAPDFVTGRPADLLALLAAVIV